MTGCKGLSRLLYFTMHWTTESDSPSHTPQAHDPLRRRSRAGVRAWV